MANRNNNLEELTINMEIPFREGTNNLIMAPSQFGYNLEKLQEWLESNGVSYSKVPEVKSYDELPGLVGDNPPSVYVVAVNDDNDLTQIRRLIDSKEIKKLLRPYDSVILSYYQAGKGGGSNSDFDVPLKTHGKMLNSK